MNDLITILEHPYNYIYSFFITVSLGVWLISLLGFIKDFDIGSKDISVDAHSGLFENFVHWLGFGTIPASILITLLLLFQGIFGIVFNELFFKKGDSFWILVALFFMALGLSFVAVSLFKKPLRFLFADYGKADNSESLVGKIAIVSSGQANETFGQAEVFLENGTNITIAIRTTKQEISFAYGQKVLLTYFDAEKNVYWCEEYD